MEKTLDKICELKEGLVSYACEHKDEAEFFEPMTEVTDMIKDLAEAEYYMSITEAMKEAEETPERMGYDHYRYSSGRFAPTGHGHYSGYTKSMMMDDRYNRMGYPMNGEHAIDRWDDARRHYHESHSDSDKKAMDKHAHDHLEETIVSVKEIWKEADPEMRQKIKQSMTGLINEMQ